mmetsp:Transcript_4454/g.12107  ORF Transcript_4454/g.12107 Transcript_4454/m.12107 type:complete len:273 (-) Transcript_4454:211-1029(-)
MCAEAAGVPNDASGDQPARSCCGFPGVVGLIACWLLAVATFAVFAGSNQAISDCKSRCGTNCVTFEGNGINRMCNGRAEACFSTCGNLQNNRQLIVSLNGCMDANCASACPGVGSEWDSFLSAYKPLMEGRVLTPPPGVMPTIPIPLVSSTSFWRSGDCEQNNCTKVRLSSNCTECRGDCEESVNITGALKEQQLCLSQRDCDQVARDEWAEAQACAEQESCEGGPLSSVLMLMLMFFWPIFGTLCCATYKESTQCSPPSKWSVLQRLGRCS